MNEITLRNGEVAFLPDGTMIMNDDTMLGLINKLDALDDMAEEFDDYDEFPSQEDIDAYFAAQHDINKERESSKKYDSEDGEIEVGLDNSDDEIEFTPEDADEELEEKSEEDAGANKKDAEYLEALEKSFEKVIELLVKIGGPEILNK